MGQTYFDTYVTVTCMLAQETQCLQLQNLTKRLLPVQILLLVVDTCPWHQDSKASSIPIFTRHLQCASVALTAKTCIAAIALYAWLQQLQSITTVVYDSLQHIDASLVALSVVHNQVHYQLVFIQCVHVMQLAYDVH